ncbi:hypothetical protein MHYP_G00142510 [Metynnis hypsauchen]
MGAPPPDDQQGVRNSATSFRGHFYFHSYSDISRLFWAGIGWRPALKTRQGSRPRKPRPFCTGTGKPAPSSKAQSHPRVKRLLVQIALRAVRGVAVLETIPNANAGLSSAQHP